MILLKKNKDKIVSSELSQNPSIFELDYEVLKDVIYSYHIL